MINDNDPLQQKLNRFASQYPTVLNKLAEYIQNMDISIRQIIEAKNIDKVIDLVGDDADGFMIELAGLVRYFIETETNRETK